MTRRSGVPAPPWVLAAALLALLLPLYVGLLPWAFDDAYIHLRIAANLAAGEGPYVNPGQAVNASSAPAWTLALAALKLLGGTTLWVACVNALLTALGAAIFVGLLAPLGGRPPGKLLSIVFALAYCGSVQFAGAGLMEAPAALCLLGAALRLWLRDRAWSFPLFSLACFLRLELAVFALLFLGATTFSNRIDRRRAWAGAALGALPFVVALLVAFGSVVPHTAAAKARVYALSLAGAWNVLAGVTVPGEGGVVGTVFRWVCFPLALLLLAGCARAALRAPDSREGQALWLLGAGASAILSTYLATRTLVFPWYAPLFVVPGLLFAVALTRRAGGGWRTIAIAVLLLAPFAADLLPSAHAVFGGRPASYRYFAENARARKYRELGARLWAAYPGARLLSSEVGGLGDGFKGEILDGAGLVSPAALAYHPMRVPEQRRNGLLGAIPAAFVEQVRPELIVSMDIFAEDLLRSDWRENYRLYREPLYVEEDLQAGAPAVLWGSTAMDVFVRKDLAPFWTP